MPTKKEGGDVGWDGIKLTPKQEAFVDHYIATLNASEAARRAGYSGKTAHKIGQENLHKPAIQAAIDACLAEKRSARIAAQDEVLELLTSVLRGELEEDTVVVEGTGKGFSKARVLRKQADARARLKAAELLGRRYGAFDVQPIQDTTQADDGLMNALMGAAGEVWHGDSDLDT